MPQPSPQPSPSAAPDAKVSQLRPLLDAIGPGRLVELFVLANLSFLGVDILIAHWINRFAHWTEWIPLAFSGFGVFVLLALGGYARFDPKACAFRRGGLLVGWGAIGVGVAGMIFHLDSQFFRQWTLGSLVYSAPFIAPLAYTGVGLLLILNRMTEPGTEEWTWWIIFLTWAGFVGNFGLSLADHAANGFFYLSEWSAVAASALAVGFLFVVLLGISTRAFVLICFGVMGIEVCAGLLGFFLHVTADLHGPSSTLRDNFVFGAPAFAPLLFANLALLGTIGLWVLLGPNPRVTSTNGR